MNRRFMIVVAVVLGLVALSALFWAPPLFAPRVVEATSLPPTPTLTPTPTPPVEVEVQVTVRDGETSRPLPGANVSAGALRATTDRAGRCTLSWPNGETYAIVVEAERYLPGEQTLAVAVQVVETLTTTITLSPTEASGLVLGYQNRPLAGATLVFGGQQVTVDADGAFVARRVAVGDLVSVTHPGYLAYETSYAGTPLAISLTPITMTFDVYDTLTGRPLAGASVCVAEGVCERVDDAGRVVAHEAVAGGAVVVQRAGYVSATVACSEREPARVALAPQQLTGVIRDAESGHPLTDTILVVNDGVIAPVDAEGRYHLPDVTQVYTLFVKTPGYRRAAIPFDAGTTIAQQDALAVCSEPGDLPCADIVLEKFAVKGIYVTFNLLMWNRDRVLELIDFVDHSPILNAIVVDIKSDRGHIAFESDDPIVSSGNAMSTPRLPLPEFIQLCHERGIYTIARMVIFKDNELIKARPELAVRHPDGSIFYDREGMAWGDPTRPEVWEYNIAISKEAIKLGFDEIQYDYLRYPSDSTSLEVVRALIYSIPYSLESRVAAVSGFVAAAKAAIDPTPAFLSADIFGFALVVDPDHDMRIGQRLKDIAPLVDYVCPMIYPSTFIPGNLGLKSPSDEPYKVIEISMQYGLARTDTIIRPWLQHYWYDRHEIAEQRRAAEAASDAGWCYWNAGAKYDELFFNPPQEGGD